jgi:hypothetical protein
MNIELLPRGGFTITLENKQKVEGRFSMAALDRFCEDHNIESYYEMLSKIALGMKVRDYGDYILTAIQDKYDDPSKCKFTRKDVLEWIDEWGGLQSEEFLAIMKHGYEKITRIKSQEENQKTTKKKETQSRK